MLIEQLVPIFIAVLQGRIYPKGISSEPTSKKSFYILVCGNHKILYEKNLSISLTSEWNKVQGVSIRYEIADSAHIFDQTGIFISFGDTLDLGLQLTF